MSAIHPIQSEADVRSSVLARTCAIAVTMIGWLAAALRRHRGRKELARLDEHLLRDVGLTRHATKHRARKPAGKV